MTKQKRMSQKVYITGIGIISSIGNDVEATFRSLVEERSGIAGITLLETSLKDKFPLAEVKMTIRELLDYATVSQRKNLTRTALLGMIAAREAIRSAGINDVSECRTGLISATTVGGMDRSENFYKEFLADPKKGRLIDIVNHDCGDSTERIAEHIGIRDYMTTISTACSSSANSIMFGAQLIKAGFLDRVVAGGTDSVTKFTLNGFNTLMILDRNGCRPFDENRQGLTLGEGAAFVVLESEASVQVRQKTVLATLSGYGNANDAYHQTASSPEGTGAFLAMQKALELSGLRPEEINYVNVHGTGTQNNDLSEGVAMQNIFAGNVPPFSSTKSYTGHTLGAAGAIEAVISVLSIRHGILFPNLRFETPMKELNIKPITKVMKGIEVRNILSNSFGFGGNNSTLILSKST
jgi:3-oxoacyl-(acyl-carrier-protein) synthase